MGDRYLSPFKYISGSQNKITFSFSIICQIFIFLKKFHWKQINLKFFLSNKLDTVYSLKTIFNVKFLLLLFVNKNLVILLLYILWSCTVVFLTCLPNFYEFFSIKLTLMLNKYTVHFCKLFIIKATNVGLHIFKWQFYRSQTKMY